jgi:hypothetical protein
MDESCAFSHAYSTSLRVYGLPPPPPAGADGADPAGEGDFDWCCDDFLKLSLVAARVSEIHFSVLARTDHALKDGDDGGSWDASYMDSAADRHVRRPKRAA